MDFRQIKYFLTLCDTLNFTQAAKLSHISQPTLTQSIKRLEDELGGSLIIRDGRDTRLSQLGRQLKVQFEDLMCKSNALRETAEALTKGETASLSIGVSEATGPTFFSHLLAYFCRDPANVHQST